MDDEAARHDEGATHEQRPRGSLAEEEERDALAHGEEDDDVQPERPPERERGLVDEQPVAREEEDTEDVPSRVTGEAAPHAEIAEHLRDGGGDEERDGQGRCPQRWR